MKRTPTPVLLLHHRGLNSVWGIWWFVAWTAAVLSSQVSIPRIDPGVSSTSSALEQLGAIGLCVPLVLVAMLVQDRTSWLTASSARNGIRLRLASLALIAAISILTAMLAALLYPRDISWLRIVCLFALLLAFTLITGTLLGGVWAALLAPVFAVLNAVPGLVPWQWNIVYNPATDAILLVAALTSMLAALLTSVIQAKPA
ncbi:hypothetical protein [Arthrobacter tecti]